MELTWSAELGAYSTPAFRQAQVIDVDDELADLGVLVRDSQQIEHEVLEQAQQAAADADAAAARKRADKRAAAAAAGGGGSKKNGKRKAHAAEEGGKDERVVLPLPSTLASSSAAAIVPASSSLAAAAAHAATDNSAAASAGDDGGAIDADERLARLLSQSTREMRVGVARRRASEAASSSSTGTGGRRRERADDGDSSADEEYVPGEDDEDDDDEEEEEDELEELEDEDEEGEIREERRPRSNGSANSVTGTKRAGIGGAASAKRRKGTTAFDKSPYTASDEEADDEDLGHGMTAPGRICKRMYEHQRICLDWLCGLHAQNAGGIVGDEMGLGKTLQMVSLFATLQRSGRGGCCLVVAPATVLRQWQREFRRWAPEITSVAVLHSSGDGGSDSSARVATVRRACSVAAGKCSVLITSYEMMRIQASLLLAQRWQYIVLDEGHKIRNPDAEVTLIAKRFNTAHRIILTGCPIQNKLNELWSLFDFVFPGRLGTLPTFQENFSIPISSGAYANASSFKVQAAYQCSVVLRDLIRPYLLRRTKADVQLNLPSKSEQVLFCQLTEDQRQVYEDFLRTDLVARVLAGRANAFMALTSVLKVCNHPHLLTWKDDDESSGPSSGERYGDWRLSGKMTVLRKVLRMWHDRRDRVLVFCQTRQMLDIVQAFVAPQYSFRRLDGTTPVGARLALIDEYNTDERIFAFLLTTRAGGLGVNLTGANRVILVDPDWNPANDLQARERAYRIGQQRAVTVYRLVTAGTLEEKVYQRQIFKQVLSNNVLKDPKMTRRVFKPRDLRDLLAPPIMQSAAAGTETGDLFANAEHVNGAPDGTTTQAAEVAGGTMPSSSAPSATNADEDAGAADQEEKREETGFLSQLLSGEFLASALDHDVVVGDAGSKKNTTATAEARKVAERAAASLKASAESRIHERVNLPTWTGRNGAAGMPKRFGTAINPALGRPSSATGTAAEGEARSAGGASFFANGTSSSAVVGSASLLQRIRDRQEAAADAAGPESEATRILKRLCAFMKQRGGKCSSQLLVEEFQQADVDPRLFKQLLKEAAEQDPATKNWVLRASWRNFEAS